MRTVSQKGTFWQTKKMQLPFEIHGTVNSWAWSKAWILVLVRESTDN